MIIIIIIINFINHPIIPLPIQSPIPGYASV